MASSLNRRPEDKAKEERAEDVNMVMKPTADNDDSDMYGGMNETSRLLHAMREEPWQHLNWVDHNVNTYRSLFLSPCLSSFTQLIVLPG